MEGSETRIGLITLQEKVAYLETVVKEIKDNSVTHSDIEVLKVGINNVEKSMKDIKLDLLPLRDYKIVRSICFSTVTIVLLYVATEIIKGAL